MKLMFELSILVIFFAVFKWVGIYPAIATAMLLYMAQLSYQWFTHKRIEALQWVTLGMVLILGGASLFFHNELFFKWKPTVVYIIFAAGILISPYYTHTPTIQKLLGQQLSLPKRIWSQLDIAWALFFVVCALLNVLIAYSYPTETWVYFKLFGSLLLIGLFILAQAIWLAPYLNNQEQSE